MMRSSIHPSSRETLRQYDAVLPHALIIEAEAGVGARTIAYDIAARHDPQFYRVSPESTRGSLAKIAVDMIRDLSARLITKTHHARVVVIDDADTMTHQAQNALLKLLEEPGDRVSIILVTHESGRLLPTVRSRAHSIRLQRVTTKQSEEVLDVLEQHDPARRRQLLFLADGRPAELVRLVRDEAYFEDRAAVLRDARSILQSSPYERYVKLQPYIAQRERALQVLHSMASLMMYDLHAKQHASDESITMLDRLVRAIDDLGVNANIRLTLLAAVV